MDDPDGNKMGCGITNIWTLQTWTETGKNLVFSVFVWLKLKKLLSKGELSAGTGMQVAILLNVPKYQ